jgi:nucleoside-diphosphate-sugar epimerase
MLTGPFPSLFLVIGDATRAKKLLGWEPKVRFPELVRIMEDADLALVEANLLDRAVRFERVAWQGFTAMFETTETGVTKRIAVVTGGAGFLGSHLCDRLLGEGFRVIAIDNLITGNTDNIEHLAWNP